MYTETQQSVLLNNLLPFYRTEDENGEYNPDNNLDVIIRIQRKSSRAKEALPIAQALDDAEGQATEGQAGPGQRRRASRLTMGELDWFVTNYAKKYNTTYIIQDPHSREPRRFKVYKEYLMVLESYRKERLDPFRRDERIQVPYRQTQTYTTTIGQLQFFKWAIQNKVVEYVEQHYDAIRLDRQQRNGTAKSRGDERTEPKSETAASETATAAATSETATATAAAAETTSVAPHPLKTRKKRRELSAAPTRSIQKEYVDTVIRFR